MNSVIQILVTPLAVFVKSAPPILLEEFQVTFQAPCCEEFRISWARRTEKFFRHCRDPRSPKKSVPGQFDIKMAQSFAKPRTLAKMIRQNRCEQLRADSLPLSRRWTQFGPGNLSLIKELLARHRYQCNIVQLCPNKQVLHESVNQDFFQALDCTSQELARRWIEQQLAWTRTMPGKEISFAAELALLNRKQSLVIVMAPSKSESNAFRNYFSTADRCRIMDWGENVPLQTKNIYLATPRYSIPLHCLQPVTLIVLSAEKMLHHQLFTEWCLLNPTFRRYGIFCDSNPLTHYDQEKSTLIFGSVLPCKHETPNIAQVKTYDARFELPKHQEILATNVVIRKRHMIWGNYERNQLIASLASHLDGDGKPLADEITLQAHNEILESRVAQKHTLIIVENEEQGLNIRDLLPGYRTILRSNVNPAGFVAWDDCAQLCSGSIITLAAFEALQSYSCDLVIRADATDAILDFSKTMVLQPFQPRSQRVIVISERRRVNRTIQRRRPNTRRR